MNEDYYNEELLIEGLSDKLTLGLGFKNLVLSVFSALATGYEVNYIVDQINDIPQPIEKKVDALKYIEDKIPEINFKDTTQKFRFDKLVDSLLDYYESEVEPTAKDTTTNVGTQISKGIDAAKKTLNKDVTIEDIKKYIIPSEIYGDDLDSPENRKFFSPYEDYLGNWTIGIGHLIGDGSDDAKNEFVKKYGKRISKKQVLKLFEKQVIKKYNDVKKKFEHEWPYFSNDLKKVLVDIHFRGDLLNPKSKEEFQFVKDIRNQNFAKAAKEYLDHTEYKAAYEKNKEHGLVIRMNNNAKIIKNQKKVPMPKNLKKMQLTKNDKQG